MLSLPGSVPGSQDALLGAPRLDPPPCLSPCSRKTPAPAQPCPELSSATTLDNVCVHKRGDELVPEGLAGRREEVGFCSK